jgi:hypothetical protein
MFSGYCKTLGNVSSSANLFNFFCAMFANVVVEKIIKRFLPTVSKTLPTICFIKPNASFRRFIA